VGFLIAFPPESQSKSPIPVSPHGSGGPSLTR
jgi:hypothetical protein